jgi:hypothetical protein
MCSTFQRAPQALDVVGCEFPGVRREHGLTLRRRLRERDELAHDPRQLAARLPKLVLGFTREPRVRPGTVQHEHATDRLAAELFADAVGPVEQLERLRYRPEIERPRLDRQEREVRCDRGALRDVAESGRSAEEDVRVASRDLLEAR